LWGLMIAVTSFISGTVALSFVSSADDGTDRSLVVQLRN